MWSCIISLVCVRRAINHRDKKLFVWYVDDQFLRKPFFFSKFRFLSRFDWFSSLVSISVSCHWRSSSFETIDAMNSLNGKPVRSDLNENKRKRLPRLFGAFPSARRPLKIYNIFDCLARINTMLSVGELVSLVLLRILAAIDFHIVVELVQLQFLRIHRQGLSHYRYPSCLYMARRGCRHGKTLLTEQQWSARSRRRFVWKVAS